MHRPMRMAWRFIRTLLLLCIAHLLLHGAALAQGTPSNAQSQTLDPTCSIGVEFGVRVEPPKDDVRDAAFASTLAGLKNGLTVPTNGHIALTARNLTVAPMPGIVTFTFYRRPNGQDAGQIAQPRSFRLPLQTDQLAQWTPPILDAPAGADAAPAREMILVAASFRPDNQTKPCVVQDFAVVQWSWNGNPDEGAVWPFQPPPAVVKIPPSRSRVDSPKIVFAALNHSPEQINTVVPTAVFFAVDEPLRCCGEQCRHTVIQFVRHRWKVANTEKFGDLWNLDVADKEAEQHDKGHDYDPTFSNHLGGRSDDLVRVGPWDGVGTAAAITVIDLPGLLPPMHDQLVQNGGWFSWEYVTLLVCAQDPGDQDQYLSSAKVQALMHYYILQSYIKGDPNPDIRVEEVRAEPVGGAVFYSECQGLKPLLAKFGLLQAYENPRPHVRKPD
jgi:hypothetical protein